MLVDIHPALDISVLVNNLKTASARRARNQFTQHLAPLGESDDQSGFANWLRFAILSLKERRLRLMCKVA